MMNCRMSSSRVSRPMKFNSIMKQSKMSSNYAEPEINSILMDCRPPRSATLDEAAQVGDACRRVVRGAVKVVKACLLFLSLSLRMLRLIKHLLTTVNILALLCGSSQEELLPREVLYCLNICFILILSGCHSPTGTRERPLPNLDRRRRRRRHHRAFVFLLQKESANIVSSDVCLSLRDKHNLV